MRADMARIVAVLALTAISAIPQQPAALGQAGQGAGPRERVRHAPVTPRSGITAVPQNGRRDLFAPPPGVTVRGAGPGGASVQLPPMPIPESPGPAVPPASLPAVPAQRQGTGAQVPPVALRGIVLGATPQAVLVSNGAYKIVTVGQGTPWGTVRSITATTVAFDTASGSHTLTFEATPAVANDKTLGSSP
jgi:hypothetical protein